MVHDVAFASDAWVTCAVRSARTGWERIPEPGPPTYVAALDWLHGQDLALPLPPPESPTTTVWSIFPDGSVMHMTGPDVTGHVGRVLDKWSLPLYQAAPDLTSSVFFQNVCEF